MRVRILRSAIEDIVLARQFYDSQAVGIGEYFSDSIFAEIDSFVLHAGIHQIQYSFFRLITRRFPYAVYYKIIDGDILVFRIMDCRRNPGWIRRRLSS